MKGKKTKKKEDAESISSLNKKKFKFNSIAVPDKSFEVFDFSESASDKEYRASFPMTTKRKVPTRSSAENERFNLNSKTVKGENSKKRTACSILTDQVNIVLVAQNVRIENVINKMDTSSNCQEKSNSLLKRFSLKENKVGKMKDNENQPPNNQTGGIEDESLPGPSKQQDSVFTCPVCNQQLSSTLSLREKEIHINSCLDAGQTAMKEKSPIATKHNSGENIASSMQNEIWGKGKKSKQKCDCGKDLSGYDFLNVQSHLFQCKHTSTDSTSLKTGQNKAKTKKSRTKKKKSEKKFCPICMKLQCSDDSKLIAHLRQCAVKHNVSTSKVLCLIKEIQWTGFKNKSKKSKKEENTSVLIKYSSEIKDEVVNQMKLIQNAYKECTNLLESTSAFNKSKVDELSCFNICNTRRKLWDMTSSKINSDDNSSLYLTHIHKDIHKTEIEVKNDELDNIENKEIPIMPKSDENISDVAKDESVNVPVEDQSDVKNLDLNDKTILYSNSESNMDAGEVTNDKKDVNFIEQSNGNLDEKNKQSSPEGIPCQRGSSESSIMSYCDQNSVQNVNVSKDPDEGNGFIDASTCIKEMQTNSSKDLIENLSTLLKSSMQTDFLFKCKDDVDVKAHCLFLSFRCSYLESMILSGTKEMGLIDIPANVVKIVLKYLYTGMLPSESDSIEDIYKLSKKFSLSQLIEFCTFLKPELLVNDASNDVVPNDGSAVEVFYSPVDQNEDVGDDSCFSQDELDELQGLFQTQVMKEYSHEHKETVNTNDGVPLSESDEDDCDSDDEKSISSSKDGSNEMIEEEKTSELVRGDEIIEDEKRGELVVSDEKMDEVEVENNAIDSINNVSETKESGAESCYYENDVNDDKFNMEVDVMDNEKDGDYNSNKSYTENKTLNNADSCHSNDALTTENQNEMTNETKNDKSLKNSLVSNETHVSLSEIFFNESNEQQTILSKETMTKKEEKPVTVLVSDSETDLDETLDVEPLVDEDEEQICNDNEELSSCKSKNQPADEKNDACQGDNIIEPISPCLANNNLFQNDCSQISAEMTYNENSPKNLLNIESTPTKASVVETQEDATLKLTLNLTSNSPVALSFGTPFLSCQTPKVVENNDNDMNNDTSLHPLDHAEATVIDEFAYEKLNRFLKETHEEPVKKQDESNHSLVEEEVNDKNNEWSSCDKSDQVTSNSPETFTQGFSIDFQISTAFDLNNSVDIISTKEGDIPMDNQNKNLKETTDLLLGSNRKREVSERKRESSAISLKRNNSDCSDESVSSGNSQKNINSFIQNRRKNKRKKVSQSSRQKNVESRSSSDDDISESDVPINPSMLLKTPKISPRRSSSRKLIKTYSTTSPYVSKDNSWLSTKDSPNKKSMNRSITRRVKGKNGNAFKEIAKENMDQLSTEKGKSKKRTSFKEMVNQKNIDLSSTDESVSENEEEVTCTSAANNSKQSRNLIVFGDEDAIIEDMFRTTSRSTSKVEQMGLENDNELSGENVSVIKESDDDDDDDVQNFVSDKTEDNFLGAQAIDPPEVDNQNSNSSGKQDDCSFPANEYMDDFMDDGGYNSFVMNMECLESNKDKTKDTLKPNDEENVSLINQSLNKQVENNEKITNGDKSTNNLMISSCSIDDALINFQTPGQEKATSKSKLSSIGVSTPTNSSFHNEFQSSTPLEPDESMDEESRKELIEACKNFRPGFNIHPKTKEPITPMPDYSSLPTPKLKDEMKKYALRNIPKHKMIAKMKEIYKFQHEFDHWEEEAKKAPPKKKAKTNPKSKDKEKISEQTEIDGKNTGSELNKGSVKGKGKKKLKSTKPDKEDDEELKQSQIDSVSLDEKIMNYITSNPQLHHKVLTYTPLEFLDLMTLLKSSEIKCSKKNLEIFLDKQCICYYTAKDEQQVPRRKKRKKEKTSMSQEE